MPSEAVNQHYCSQPSLLAGSFNIVHLYICFAILTCNLHSFDYSSKAVLSWLYVQSCLENVLLINPARFLFALLDLYKHNYMYLCFITFSSGYKCLDC